MSFTVLFVLFNVKGCVNIAGRFGFCIHVEIIYRPFHVVVPGVNKL